MRAALRQWLLSSRRTEQVLYGHDLPVFQDVVTNSLTRSQGGTGPAWSEPHNGQRTRKGVCRCVWRWGEGVRGAACPSGRDRISRPMKLDESLKHDMI